MGGADLFKPTQLGPTNPNYSQHIDTNLSVDSNLNIDKYVIANGKVYQYAQPKAQQQTTNSHTNINLQAHAQTLNINKIQNFQLIFLQDSVTALSAFAVENNIASILTINNQGENVAISMQYPHSTAYGQSSLDAEYTLGEMATNSSTKLTYTNGEFVVGKTKGSTSLTAATSSSEALIMHIKAGSFTLNNSTYFLASGKTGRAFCIDAGELNLIEVTLNGFNHTDNGGAIYMKGGSLNATNTTIQNCSADSGGAIYMYGGSSSVNITGGSVSYNTATSGGGVICAVYDSSNINVDAITLTNLNSLGNSASGYGGVVCLTTLSVGAGTTDLSITGGSYINNSGSCVYIGIGGPSSMAGTFVTTSISSATFEGNSGAGTIYFAGFGDDIVSTIESCTFNNNIAAEIYGDYGADVASKAVTQITDCTFTNSDQYLNISNNSSRGSLTLSGTNYIETASNFAIKSIGSLILNSTPSINSTVDIYLGNESSSYITLNTCLTEALTVYKDGITSFIAGDLATSYIAYSTDPQKLQSALQYITVVNLPVDTELSSTAKANYLVCAPASRTVSISVYNTGYGSVDVSSVSVDYGTAWSISGNTLTIGDTVITATPADATTEYIYSFVMWTGSDSVGSSFDSDSGTITAETLFYAHFTRAIRTYILSINTMEYGVGETSANGIVGTHFSFAAGTVVTLSVTILPGYTFNSWSVLTGGVNISGNSFTMPANDVRLGLVTTANTITISLNSQGADSNGHLYFYYKYGIETFYESKYTGDDISQYGQLSGEITGIDVPTKSHYTFGGYYTSTGGSGTQYINASGLISTSLATGITEDATLYAKWTPVNYTITIARSEIYGNISTTSVVAPYGSIINVGESPNILLINGTQVIATISSQIDGYTRSFVNWINNDVPVTTTGFSITGATTVVAKFKQTANTYTITWNGNATAGDLLQANLWNYAGSSGYTSTNGGYNSSYTTSGIIATSIMTYKVAASYKAPIPIRRGYTFNGWYTAASGGVIIANNSGDFIANVSNYTDPDRKWIHLSNTTLYAQYTIKTYSVTVDNNGGSGSGNTTYTVASGATISVPTLTGYTFSGWNVSVALDKLYNATINISTGVQEYNSSYSSAVYYEPFYIKSGISYKGALGEGQIRWRTFNASTGAFISNYSSDVIVSGNNTNTILWYHLGNTNETTTVSFSTGASAFKTADYNLTGDATLTAQWTINSYTITIAVNNSSYGSVDITSVNTTHGKKIYISSTNDNILIVTAASNISITASAKSGYLFDCWTVSSAGGTEITDEITITGAITIYANFVEPQVETYVVTFGAGIGGSVTPTSITVVSGTTYSASGSYLNFSDGQSARAVGSTLFGKQYAFENWKIGTTVTYSGTITAATTIKATFYATGTSITPGIGGASVNELDSSIKASYTVVTTEAEVQTSCAEVWLDDKFRKLQDEQFHQVDFDGISFNT